MHQQVRAELFNSTMDKLECVQLLPDGSDIVHSEKTGEKYWLSKIDDKAVACLERSTKKIRPKAICLGMEGRYFVRFSGGDAECSGLVEIRDDGARRDVHSYVVVLENMLKKFRGTCLVC